VSEEKTTQNFSAANETNEKTNAKIQKSIFASKKKIINDGAPHFMTALND
jgi:hypothetical protein